MGSDSSEIVLPMLLERLPPADGRKKRASWPQRLQIPLGVMVVGLVSAGVLCLLSLANSNDIERAQAGHLDDFNRGQERDRRNMLSSGSGSSR